MLKGTLALEQQGALAPAHQPLPCHLALPTAYQPGVTCRLPNGFDFSQKNMVLLPSFCESKLPDWLACLVRSRSLVVGACAVEGARWRFFVW